MSVVARRKLIEAAQHLAKTNAPTNEHYRVLLDAVAEVYAADSGIDCQCILIDTPQEERAAP
jgi:hypothetical protein